MLGILFSMVILVAVFPANGDFRIDNPFWNGLSTFNSNLGVSAVSSLDELPPDPFGSALVLIPYNPFSSSDLESVKSFVSNGGTLIVADDYGFGNQVLESMGLSISFSGLPLLDPLFDYRSKWLPEISDFADSDLTFNVSSVVLNHASILDGTEDCFILASSSEFSFLDVNCDSVWNDGEPVGPFPVVAYSGVGKGFVVVISDPSILINGMVGLGDNLVFVRNLVSLGGSGDQVFFDVNHLPSSALDEAKGAISFVYGVAVSPWGTLSLIAVVLALSLKPMWSRGRKGDRKN
jgi:hypothetical protein